MRCVATAILLLIAACAAPEPRDVAAADSAGFVPSFIAGSQDAAGRFMGGTEMRVLTAHAGRLYAGNGYWEDRPGSEGPQGAQILVLDQPGGPWRVDHSFGDRMPNGRPRDLAVSALREVNFTTDAGGRRLPTQVSLLLVATWDLTGTSRVFSRDDDSGNWAAMTLAQDPTARDFLPQVRSFGMHRDKITGIDHVFAGQDPRGIFQGSYDAAVPGRIRWDATPELGIARIDTSKFPGLGGRVRISSFAECNGLLYAAIGQQIYQRIDGASPSWRLVYTNPQPGHSETGLRGLTTIRNPSGSGEVLLAAVEGSAARIIRVDPHSGVEATELDLVAFLGGEWQMRVGYVIAAYNDMAALPAGSRLLIGLEAFIPAAEAVSPGHNVVNVGYGRVDAGGWYLVRQPDARYTLRRIGLAGRPLVAVRSISASPFPGDRALYFAGYDANKAPAHDTAWVARADVAVAAP